MNPQQNPSFQALPFSPMGGRMSFVRSGGSFIMEIWKPVKNFESLYRVSNKGNLKSLDRTSIVRHGRTGVIYRRKARGRMLKLGSHSAGYPQTLLSKNSIKYSFCVHRLVAIAFIPNPENKRCVNHKDGIKNNNKVENLEWCTYSENTIHSFEVLGRVGSGTGIKGKDHCQSKPVNKLSLDGEFIEAFDSGREAADSVNGDGATIGKVCNGHNYSAYKFKWEHA